MKTGTAPQEPKAGGTGSDEPKTGAAPPEMTTEGTVPAASKPDTAPDAPKKGAGKIAGVTETAAAGPPADSKPAGGSAAESKSTATDGTTSEDNGTDGKASGDSKAPGDGKAGAGAAGSAAAGAQKDSAAVKSGKPGRRFRPLHVTGRAARGVVTWTKGPSGRVVVPGVMVIALIAGAGAAGAYLVPEALEAKPTPSATPAFGEGAQGSAPAGVPGAGLPGAGSMPPNYPGPGATVPGGPPAASGLPGATLPGLPPSAAPVNVRPADSLASWATQVGTRVGVPVVAVQAYGYAELVTAQTTPSCHLSWTTLAAIGKVESSHGSYNGAVLGADGVATPTIFGLPLDGQGGRQLIADTDQGALDQDTTFDRAIGPMQFIPATWKATAVDADRDGVANPNDIDDAALTAASYLCKGGRDLSRAEAWWDAILSYNAVRPYAQKVFNTADEYGRRSR